MFAKFRKFLKLDDHVMVACSSRCEALVVSVMDAIGFASVEVEIHNRPANLNGLELETLPCPCGIFGFDLFAVSLARNIGLPIYL